MFHTLQMQCAGLYNFYTIRPQWLETLLRQQCLIDLVGADELLDYFVTAWLNITKPRCHPMANLGIDLIGK